MISRVEITNTICNVIGKQLGFDTDKMALIKGDDSLFSLKADSLDLFTIIHSIELLFKIESEVE